MRQYCTIRRVEGKGVQCNQACGASHIAGEWGLGTEGVWPSLVCFVAARWNPVWAQIHSLAEHELVLLITLPQPLSLRITGMPTPPYLLNYLKKKPYTCSCQKNNCTLGHSPPRNENSYPQRKPPMDVHSCSTCHGPDLDYHCVFPWAHRLWATTQSTTTKA